MPGQPCAVAVAVLTATLTVGVSPVHAADPSASPQPSATADPLAGLPAPPAWFDPAVIPFVGYAAGWYEVSTEDSAYAGRLGSAPARVPIENTAVIRTAGDGLLVITHGGDNTTAYRLSTVAPDGAVMEVADDLWHPLFALDADGDTAYAARITPGDRATSTGLWRIPLDGSPPERVLPPSPIDEIFVSPDERSVAVTWLEGDEGPSYTWLGTDGRRPARLTATAIGFDASSRLVAWQRNRLVLRHPRSGSVRSLPRLPPVRVQVTPDGRWLAWVHRRRVEALDLVDGDRRSWDLRGDQWFLTELGGSRYAVAVGRSSKRLELWEHDLFAVVDLHEGWLGYVPIVRAAD